MALDITPIEAVGLNVQRNLFLGDRTLKILSLASEEDRGYSEVTTIADNWFVETGSPGKPLDLQIAQIDPVTKDQLRKAAFFALDDAVYRVVDKGVDQPFGESLIWVFRIEPTTETFS